MIYGLKRQTECCVLFVCLMSISTFSRAMAQDWEWVEQDVPFSNGMLNSIFFVSPDTGLAVGYDDITGHSAIVHTTNGGEEWAYPSNPVVNRVNAEDRTRLCRS